MREFAAVRFESMVAAHAQVWGRGQMKPYRSLWVSLGFCTLLVANAAASDAVDGRYAGAFNGQPAAAELETQAGRINGTLVIGGYTYRIATRAAGTGAEGELTDEEGIAIPLALQASGNNLRLQIFMHGDGAPVELALQRGGGSPAAGETRVERDPVLVGAWVKSESYTSGDFSMVDQKTVQLLPDGHLVIGPARLIGGGDAGSFDSGSGGGGGGEWRTADRILYTREPGTGWAPYGRYYVEGNRMMVTFGDGSREVWSRR